MGVVMKLLKPIVTALLVTPLGMTTAQGQSDRTAELLQHLREADPTDAKKIEREIDLVWRRSGSPSMDLLLNRGQDALDAGEVETAIGHFSALIDHAPEFAEGWHRRATAFYRQEEYGLAVADLEHALALNPQHFNAMFGLAVIFETLDRPDQAHAIYQQVLILYPTHERAQDAVDRLAGKVTGQTL